MNIEHLIFDIGGVVVKLRGKEAREELIQKTGIDPETWSNFLVEYFQPEALTTHEKYQIGAISTEEYIQACLELFPIKPSVEDILKLRCNTLAGENEATVLLIKELSSYNIPLSCFSNTHAIHWDYMLKNYPVFNFFQHKMASQIAKQVKPWPSAYQYMCDTVQVPPERCLFIDDLLRNCEAAEKFGMQVVHFQNAEQLRIEIVKMGLKNWPRTSPLDRGCPHPQTNSMKE
jgi:FMN phosphatase YigB (HAD superfamily)